MASDDLASNLEFWAGRARHEAAGDDAPRPLPSFRRRSFGRRRFRVPALRLPSLRLPSLPRPAVRLPARRRDTEAQTPCSGRRRARPIAAAVLLAGLAAAWLIAGHTPHGSAATEVPPPRTPTSLAAPSTTASTAAPSTTIPVTADCRGLTVARPEVKCVREGIAVDMRLLSRAGVAAAYRRATGTTPVARTGPAACAHGDPDERAWSAPSAPISAVGRYQCRLEHGLAAMWWTDGARLVHAVAPDADLAALFSWWRAHPSE